VIKPALKEGKWVICDRFFDSTMAYQGYGFDQDRQMIDQIRHLTLQDFAPGLTIILDVDPASGLSRAGKKQRYEEMDTYFHQKLRAGFHEIAKAEPDRCVVIDAAQSIDDVAAAIDRKLQRRFSL
jgi:dTMP kinase